MIQEEKYPGSKKNMKTVSLILTTYNSEKNIERTLTSIEKQDYPSIEVLIKDGGSTDRTLHIIDVYAKISKHIVKWCTGRDDGIYDAMNQGYLMAAGDIVVFFQGMFLESTAVSKMVQMIENDPECIGGYADLIYVSDNEVIKYKKIGSQKSLYSGWMPAFPVLFLKREIYEKYGLYNLKYCNVTEFEFLVRFLKDKDNRLVYLPEAVAGMYHVKLHMKNYLRILNEAHKAIRDNEIKGAGIILMMYVYRKAYSILTKKE